jgi:hypothetical protein
LATIVRSAWSPVDSWVNSAGAALLDLEGIAAQLSDVHRGSLRAVGRELDELEHRVDEFLPSAGTRVQARPGVRPP